VPTSSSELISDHRHASTKREKVVSITDYANNFEDQGYNEGNHQIEVANIRHEKRKAQKFLDKQDDVVKNNTCYHDILKKLR
jgi:hypothetical protein